MSSDKRIKSRMSFIATVEVLELQSNAYLKARTSDLSLSGCYVDTLNPLPESAEVQIRLDHNNETFKSIGIVTHSQPNMGMGVKFTAVEAEDHTVLDRWLAEINS